MSSCEKPPWEQPQPLNVYPVTTPLGMGDSEGPPVGRLIEVVAGIPGTILASIEGTTPAEGRLVVVGEPVGRIEVL